MTQLHCMAESYSVCSTREIIIIIIIIIIISKADPIFCLEVVERSEKFGYLQINMIVFRTTPQTTRGVVVFAWNKSVFGYLRPLKTWHCPQSLMRAVRAAIDRYLLPAGPTAANPPHATAEGEWDRQTDGRTDTVPFHRPFSACGRANNDVGGPSNRRYSAASRWDI